MTVPSAREPRPAEFGSAAEELRRSGERFRALIEASRDVITIVDPEGTIRYASPSAERAAGYRPDEMVGTSAISYVHAEDEERVAAQLGEILRKDALTVPISFRFRHRDGSWRVFEVVGTNRVSDPAVGGIVLNSRDITDLRAAEQSRQKLMRAVEQAENVVFMTDPRGTLTYVNPAFERLYGFTPQEALGQTPRILRSGRHEPAFYERFWKTLLDGGSVTGEMVNRARDGRFVTVETSVSPVLGAEGERIGFIAVQNDITGRRLLEEQFRQSQKMEAVGLLAAGVAHDFNNFLTAILGYADLLGMRLGESAAELEEVNEIRKAGQSAASLVRQLLAFSRKQVLELRVLDLNSIAENLRNMLRRLIGEDIELVSVMDDGIGCVRADASQIERVILNLALNARDAMPRGGTLTIETKDVVLDGEYSREHMEVRPGRYVLLAMTDTGTGMDAEAQARVFEPFFTTKAMGKGTGLGLASVYGIVKQSGGYIWVYSEVGRGTTFKIYLPCVEGIAETGPARPAAASLRGTETVLMVENEELIRDVSRKVLVSYGYTVLEAADPRRALEIASSHEGPIHILLTDIILTEMDGADLAALIETTRPGTKVLCMSGYTDETIARRGLLAPGGHFLQKPFAPSALAAKIREVLDEV